MSDDGEQIQVERSAPEFRAILDQLYVEEQEKFGPMLDAMLMEAQILRQAEGHKARGRTRHSEDTGREPQNIAGVCLNRIGTNYPMKAFGLGDRTCGLDLIRKVRQQGASDPKAPANTLNDGNIRALVKAFDYQGGNAAIGSNSFVQSVTDRYVEQAMETQQGSGKAGV